MTIARLVPVLLVLAAHGFAGGPAVERLRPVSPAGEAGNGRLSIDVADCPVAEFLLLFSEAVGCTLDVDPGIESRITLKVDAQTPEKALMRALTAVDYVIVWKTGTDGAGRRRDRIESVAVYRDGRRAM